MSYKTKRLVYIAIGVTWCLVGGQVIVSGMAMIATGGKK
jgi:hypothetical protein